jgi:uncharacterized protein (TIGR03437 family)
MDPRSLLGTITFDGAGHYSFTGQQVVGTNAPASQSGSGAYAVDPAGFVTLDSPLRAGAKVNARMGPEALLGSSTESTDNTFDLLVAIPAPTGAAALTGPFWTASLEFPGGVAANARNSLFSLNSASLGKLADFSVSGHAANISQGRPQTQQITNATFTMSADGTGSASFGAASNTVLLSGNRTLYLSASGNVILGGSSNSHDILIGVKAVSSATNATWSDRFWGAGLRLDPTAVLGYSGSVAAVGTGKLTWTKRIKALGASAFDFTGINGYTLKADGSGTVELSQVGLGAGGKAFVGSSISANDTGAYEIYFGVQMTPLTGTGVFLNPQGVVNAASFAPAGNPIAPGEFITLFGTGLAKSDQKAAPPYPPTLNGVTVMINGTAAPLYSVSAGQINALVPYATQGATATIMVQNGSANSNTVTVPLGVTSPGVYSLDQSGSGPGAILHADYSVVNTAKPAVAGETVLIYLTGMGAVNPPVKDGTAGGSNPFSNATADVAVLVGGRPCTVLYNGLAPGYPGLYQINVTLPPSFPVSGSLPLVISTNNATHDQVDVVTQ